MRRALLCTLLMLMLTLSGVTSAAELVVSSGDITAVANAVRNNRAQKRDAALSKAAPVIITDVADAKKVTRVAVPAKVNNVKAAKEEIVSIDGDKQVWGNFPEASAYVGAWKNPTSDTEGEWVNLKYMQWFTRYEKAENFGIGVNVRADYGRNTQTGNNWGYLAPGPTVGYYRGIGQKSSFETDLGLLYRFDKNRDSGLMPVLHAEYSRKINYKNRLSFQVDGNFFSNDSWAGPGVYWESKVNKNWKVTAGAGASINWLDGDTITGFMPSVKVKYKNRFSLGLSANLFSEFGASFGIIGSYELTPDMDAWYKAHKSKGVKQLNKETVSDSDQGEEPKIGVSNETIDELIQKGEKS